MQSASDGMDGMAVTRIGHRWTRHPTGIWATAKVFNADQLVSRQVTSKLVPFGRRMQFISIALCSEVLSAPYERGMRVQCGPTASRHQFPPFNAA